MKKIIVTTILFIAALNLYAQDDNVEKKGFQKEKLFLGGNFGLTFGNFTLINVSPQLGYRFTDLFAAGAGINGQYISIRNRDINGDVYSRSSLGIAGLNVFGRVYPIKQIMLQVQPEANYVFGRDIYYTGYPSGTFRRNAEIVPSLLMGGGAVLPAGRGAMLLTVFYDVMQHSLSPYGRRPIYNIGYNIGL